MSGRALSARLGGGRTGPSGQRCSLQHEEWGLSSIRQVVETVNRLQKDDVIRQYAIGGAVGATFYIEPVATMDVDIFVVFRTEPDQVLLNRKPLYGDLAFDGCRVEGEHVVIAGWPVQFLPPSGPLGEEALAGAISFDIEGVSARVCTAEHLAAIALQTGRAKDKARLLQFAEAAFLDADRLQDILTRHGLVDRWRGFERQFLGDRA